MVLTGVSRLLGFARQAVVSAVFGATGAADVLNAVFSIPNNLRKLLAEGALSSAFIPILSGLDDPDDVRGRSLVQSLLGFQLVVLGPVAVVCTLFAAPIADFLTDFSDPEQTLLAGELFRWFIHYAPLISVSAVLMGALNSRNRFVVPALTPLLFSVCVIAAILLLSDSLGIYSMAVGILAGGVAQIAIQVPSSIRSGFSVLPRFCFTTPEFQTTMRRWLPVVVASSVFAINQQAAIFFASGLEDGSSSAIVNAVIFWQLPQGIFAVSVTTVLFPRMSREARDGDKGAARQTLSFGIEANLALLLPSAVILALLSREIVAVVLQRGRFELTDTLRTARVLWAYCLGMPSVTIFTLLQRFHYANHDYRTPTTVSVAVVAVSILGSLWLKETQLRVAGLAIANSIAFTIGAVWLGASARRIVGGVFTGRILGTALKCVASVVPALAIVLVSRTLGSAWWESGSSLRGFAILSAIGLLAVGATAAMLLALRVDAARLLVGRKRNE